MTADCIRVLQFIGLAYLVGVALRLVGGAIGWFLYATDPHFPRWPRFGGSAKETEQAWNEAMTDTGGGE